MSNISPASTIGFGASRRDCFFSVVFSNFTFVVEDNVCFGSMDFDGNFSIGSGNLVLISLGGGVDLINVHCNETISES